MTTTGPTLDLEVLGTGETLSLTDCQAVVAGYTGRDEEAVRHHIAELAAIGVPAPPQVPMFYDVPVSSVTTAARVEVGGPNTSGEAEPVLVRHRDRWYLGVGSDHTDRDVETVDVGESKRACPKPVSRQVVPVPEWDELGWDAIGISARVDRRAYQNGSLRRLRRPDELTDLLRQRGLDQHRDLVCFGGTVPLLTGTFVAGTEWELRLSLPDGRALSHTYEARKV